MDLANHARLGAIELPIGLRVRMEVVRRRLRRLDAIAAIATIAVGAAISFLGFYVWERMDETPEIARWLFSGTAGFILVIRIAMWIWRWMWRPPNALEVARLIQRRIPSLGDRLLGAVELTDSVLLDRGHDSETLRRAAVEQVGREAHLIDVRAAAPSQFARQISVTAIAFVGAATLLVVREPEAGWNALERWLNPSSPVPRFTFVRIAECPREMIVPYGEPFELECTLVGKTLRSVLTASCRMGRTRWTQRVGPNGRICFQIPGPTRPTRLSLRVGDAVRHVLVRPEYRPTLPDLFAIVHFPPWHGRTNEVRRIESGWITVPEHGELVLRGRASRDLSQITLNGTSGPPVAISGPQFETVRLAAVHTEPPEGTHRLPSEIVLNWRDTLGLTPSAPMRLRVDRTLDSPPAVRCENLGGAIAILEEETLQFDVLATDDVGVHRLWIEWQEAAERGSTSAPVHTRLLATGTRDARTLRSTVVLSPDAMRWPADTTIELWAGAVDHVPDREPSYTPTYRILVLSRARHAQLLEEQARAVQAVIEELRRQEDSRRHSSEEIASFADADLMGTINEERLRSIAAAERRDADRAQKLSEEMARLALEALRNPAMAEATVLDWAMIAERLQSLSSGPMSSAVEALQAAAGERHASKRRQLAQLAADHQRTAVEQLISILRETTRTADDWAGRSFAERLRELAHRHATLAAELTHSRADFLGIEPQQLPVERRAELIRLADLQSRHREMARDVRDDLEGFFARSRRAVYDEIHRAMSEPDVLERQNENRHSILENHVARAIRLTRTLAEDFARWAKLLSPDSEGGASSGGGGGASGALTPEVLMGLLRARARQESLRETTRELERQRPYRADYRSAAEALADRQLQIEADLRKLNERVDGQIRAWMEAIEQDMIVSAATLREPQTDAGAIAIQTGIIEAIAEALNAGTESSANHDGTLSDEAIAAISRMMQALAQGGGSLAGGSTSQQNAGPEGPGQGGASSSQMPHHRSVGADEELVPAEFRALLEGYFRAMERTR